MPHAGVQKKPGNELTSKQLTLLFVMGPAFWVVMTVSLGSPIPRGKADRKTTLDFLQKVVPDRTLTPVERSDPVAAVFHLIRDGDPVLARSAIKFADEHELGYAVPYVIERLGDDDPALAQAAHAYLRNLAGIDHGADADAWRAWWRNPPRNILGLVIGEQTFALGLPAMVVLAAVILIWLGNRRALPTASFIGGVLLVLTWFNLFSLGMTRLMAAHHSCTFGSSPISYFSSHGTVLGLEDARLAGSWFVFVLLVGFVTGPILLVWAYVTFFVVPRPKEVSQCPVTPPSVSMESGDMKD